ncbi:MAG: tRNA (adenosine(37)-N6)-dimethylallyltransferase MiaA [Minisyncoccia bacterium]
MKKSSVKNGLPKVLVILGPTSMGKSDLAVRLAKKFNGEIISADSRQVYKGLNIGTGKITEKEMLGVPHHLLDVVSPKKIFSVSDFQKIAIERIENILSRGKLPIICGGTGFYIDSIVHGIVLPEVPPNPKLRKILEKKSLEELVKILKKLDKNRLENIDQKNKVRLIRAIEIAKSLGKVPKVKKEESKYDFCQIGLRIDDYNLKKKIRNRLFLRIKKGMIKEAENIHKNGLTYKRMKELGLEYRFLTDFLEKKITKVELFKKIMDGNWNYAKRQVTWFKRDEKIKWFKPTEENSIKRTVEKFLT